MVKKIGGRAPRKRTGTASGPAGAELADRPGETRLERAQRLTRPAVYQLGGEGPWYWRSLDADGGPVDDRPTAVALALGATPGPPLVVDLEHQGVRQTVPALERSHGPEPRGEENGAATEDNDKTPADPPAELEAEPVVPDSQDPP